LAISKPIVVICMWTAPLNVVRFDATTLWHFDAAERAPSTTSTTASPVTGWRGSYAPNTGHEGRRSARLTADPGGARYPGGVFGGK
jgi:hypothetical protein